MKRLPWVIIPLFLLVVIVVVIWRANRQAPGGDVQNIANTNTSRSVSPQEKYSPELRTGQIGNWARPAPGIIDVIVYYKPGTPHSQARSELEKLGADVLFASEYFERFTIRIEELKLMDVASFEWVSTVEPIPPPPTDQ